MSHKRRSLSVQPLESREVMDALPVLMVIADQQHFFYREYDHTRTSLLNAGVDVVVAATTTNPSTAHAGSGQGTGNGVVVPDIALANVDPADYSAIAFVGGWGSSMYQYAFNDPDLNGTTNNFYSNGFYNGDNNLNDGVIAPQKVIVNNLINEFLAADKFVAGVCHGVTVLAWARVDGVSPLNGKNVTVPLKDGTPAMNYNGVGYANGYVMGQYDQVTANGGLSNSVQGSIGTPGTTTDDVVVDGRIITGSDDWSAAYFGTVIAQQVLAAANQAPTNITLSASSIAENNAVGASVGTLSSTDPNPGDTFTYTLVPGAGSTDNAKFTLSGNTLHAAESFNFENATSYSVRVRTTDAGGLSFEKAFTINVTNANETPTNLGLSSNVLAENQPATTTVGHFLTTDPDSGDSFTYTLVNGAGATDNAVFSIDGINLKAAASFNYEAQNAYTIRVRTTDAGGLSFEQTFTINVSNVNETPTNLMLSNASVEEGLAVGTLVGLFSGNDPDANETFSYSLVSGTGDSGNASFSIDGNQLRTAAVFDRLVQESYSIRVRLTDAGGLTHEQQFTVNIDEVNAPPTLNNGPNLFLANLARNANPAGMPVSALLVHASDAETPATLGVAITGKFGMNGTWEYAAAANGPWTPIIAATPNAAVLLTHDTFVRFKPATNAVGYAGLLFRAWDGTGGARGQLVDPATQPACFSVATENAFVGVGMPAYNAAAELQLGTMNEDASASKTLIAKSLVGFLATAFPANTQLGVGVVGVEGHGTWQVRVGSAWQAIAGVSDTNARLLKPNDQVRFVPAADWNGVATLVVRAWNPANGMLQPFGDSTQPGFSSDRLTTALTVNPVNDAPVIDTSIARLFDNQPQVVANLLDGAGDIDSTLAGIGIVKATATNGRWEYRLTPNSAWVTIAGVSLSKGLLLDPWAEVRFTPNGGATTASGVLEYKAMDDSVAFTPGTYKSTMTTAFSKVHETATFSLGNATPTFLPGNAPTFGSVLGTQAPKTLFASAVLGRMTDTNAGFKRGLAITGTTGNGTWQYSVDNSRTWQTIGDVSSVHVLLRNTDRLRFVPASGWTGTATLSFAAWDQTSGVAGDRMTANDAISLEELTATLTVN